MRNLFTARIIMLGIVLLLLLILPLLVRDTYILHLMITAFIYAVVVSNWDLSLGYGGVFNMAHVAFFAVGAYTCAILSKLLDVNPWLAMLCAGAMAVILASVVSFPIRRLRGIYVILVTFAVSELALRVVLSQREVTGGATGMVLLPPLRIGEYNFALDGKIGYYYAGLALLIASTTFLRFVVTSNFGLAVVALKDNEDYAVCRGVSLSRNRLLMLMASGLFTGIIGGFYATYFRVASPDLFSFDLLTLFLSFVVFGGIGTIYGPIVAAFFLIFVSELMFNFGPWRYIISSALIIVVVILFPGGMMALIERFSTWIASYFRGNSRTSGSADIPATPGRS